MKKLLIAVLASLGLQFPNLSAAEDIQLPCKAWSDKRFSPTIESVIVQVEETYVTLSDGSRFKLRPVFYYLSGEDNGDYNYYYLNRRIFSSVSEIFTLPRHDGNRWNNNKYHHVNFVKGQSCQILLPHMKNRYIKNPNSFPYEYPAGYSPTFHHNIRINCHSTSDNNEPLRVNLYEHPDDERFFIDAHPNTTNMSYLVHAHLIEAELLEFKDIVDVIAKDGFKLLNSQIRAKITDDSDNNQLKTWEFGDIISAVYLEDGMYQIKNLSKGDNSIVEVFLSDPEHSDL